MRIVRIKGVGQSVSDRTGLSGQSTPLNHGRDVPFAARFRRQEGLQDQCTVAEPYKVIVQGLLIDHHLSQTGLDPYAGLCTLPSSPAIGPTPDVDDGMTFGWNVVLQPPFSLLLLLLFTAPQFPNHPVGNIVIFLTVTAVFVVVVVIVIFVVAKVSWK